jgi:hypothetical protein
MASTGSPLQREAEIPDGDARIPMANRAWWNRQREVCRSSTASVPTPRTLLGSNDHRREDDLREEQLGDEHARSQVEPPTYFLFTPSR